MDVLSALRKVTTSIKTWADSKLETKLNKNLGKDNAGQVLTISDSGDIESQILDIGIIVLSGTDDNPINIDEIKTSGTYLIKGTVTTSMDIKSESDSAKLNKMFMDGFSCGELMSVYSLQDGFINQFMMNPTRPLARLDSGTGYSDAIDVSYIQPVTKTTEMTQPVGIRRDGQLFTKPFNQVQSDWLINDEAANEYIKNKPTIPSSLADLSDDEAHRTVTDIEKSEWNEKPTNEEVDSKIASLVNSAPETLDTLNELAEALGNDPNFATTVATEIGKKVEKVDGKGLSTNDYTDEDKDKLNNISSSDWNQSDKTSLDYIKNRTHYITIEKQENELGMFEDSNITVTQMSDGNLGTCTLDTSAWTEDVDNADRIAFVYESPTQMIYVKCDWINAGWWKDKDSNITIEDYVVGVDRKYIITNLPEGAVGENTNHISLIFFKTTDIEIVTQLDEKFIPNTIARVSDIPTKTSELTNDTDFIVIFSGDGSISNPYTCTNTYFEIESAYNSGKKIIGKLNNFGFNKNGATISYGNIDIELTNIMDEATFKGYYAEFMFTLICRVLYNDSVDVELIPIRASSDSYGGIKSDEKQDTDTIPARIGADGKLYVEHTQSDWNQSDSLASDYIKNKPFGEELIYTSAYDSTVTGLINSGNTTDDGQSIYQLLNTEITSLTQCTNDDVIRYDGNLYSVPVTVSGNTYTIGDPNLVKVPFCYQYDSVYEGSGIYDYSNMSFTTTVNKETVEVSLMHSETVTKMIDSSYIPAPHQTFSVIVDLSNNSCHSNTTYAQICKMYFENREITGRLVANVSPSPWPDFGMLDLYKFDNKQEIFYFRGYYVDESSGAIWTPSFSIDSNNNVKYAVKTTYLFPKNTTINLPATNWTGDANLYSQEVTIDGITANSKIDLQPTAEQLLELQDAEITLMIVNDNCVVTAYAMNNKPIKDYEMQVLITEVASV